MHRRDFTGLAFSAAHGFAEKFADEKPRRVGLIGCGWWNPASLKSDAAWQLARLGDDQANKLLCRPYRQPWVHPEVASL